jgi:hypothetical protein
MIVFGQLFLAHTPFKYSAGLSPGLSIGCLLAIVRPEKSVKLERQKTWF